jgi:glutaredoxin
LGPHQHNTLKRGLLLALALLLAPEGSAQIYKRTDSAGRVHFTDKSPEEARREEAKIDVNAFDGTPVIRNADVVQRKQDASRAASGTLTMYATSWCVGCRQARDYLGKNGITFHEIDVEAHPDNHRRFRVYGGRGVPLFVYGPRTMRGFTPEAMEQFLAAR